MKYLAIDTSGDYLLVICRNDEKFEYHYSQMPGVKHSVSLMPVIEEVSLKAGLDLSTVDFFSSTTGPGSFTGIRIGVATVKGFADAYFKPVLPVTTLEAIAYTDIDGKNLAIIDAKHGHFYAQGFTDGKVSFEPSFISLSEVNELGKDYKMLSNGLIGGLIDNPVDLVKGLKTAVESNLDRISSDVDSLHPFYLRLSQAEEGRK